MSIAESMQAMAERRLIRSLLLALVRSESEQEQQRHMRALADLVRHADPTLDPTMFDPWTKTYLERAGLWTWEGQQVS